MLIIGAGLSGLIAAQFFPNAEIIEAKSESTLGHKALLRFRGPEVGNALGIEFKKVRVHKGIWDSEDSIFVRPDIRLANLYSLKVTGEILNRSIWDIEPCERFIAPDTMTEQLLNRNAHRIKFNSPITEMPTDLPTISTMPMNIVTKILGLKKVPEFKFKPIYVTRYRLKNADVYQTIYYPDPTINVYRASITGDLLIIESTDHCRNDESLNVVERSFGITLPGTELESTTQTYGKIAPIDNAWRRHFIFELTRRCSVYSLGRYAVWRNILLDDVIQDCHVIKRLMNSDTYEHKKL